LWNCRGNDGEINDNNNNIKWEGGDEEVKWNLWF
jgi:hypothetical protein